ncbi:hypothetical protein NDN08_007341 [Rhodosorus marinus]|uniref:Uncharacterized protein n=1 Tax=Rhodosorus marinus TaxID=101924 RepID=A0AAV8ULI8_9RHOD|nr:hypothetical protein NDN08_007341 [Rhodosorus marinus]
MDTPWILSSKKLFEAGYISSLSKRAQALATIGIATGILVLAFAIVVVLETILGKRSIVWVVLRIAGLLFVAGGVAHFVYPESYARIVPSWGAWGWWYIPGSPNFHVIWSGIAEILGGLGVLLGGVPYVPGWVGPWSANALFALTVCVTPANLFSLTHDEPGPLKDFSGAKEFRLYPNYHIRRMLAQAVVLAILCLVAVSYTSRK